MENACMKHKFVQMEKQEFQNCVDGHSYMIPYQETLSVHERSHFTKVKNTLLTCDLLKDVPYSWSITKKRTKHTFRAPDFEYNGPYVGDENHMNEKQSLFLDLDKDLLVIFNEQRNSFMNSLPIKKRKAQESNDDAQDENETGTSLKITKVLKLEEKHVCNICSKSFKSHQALGGHKAHHGRSKKLESVEFEGKSHNKIHQCCYCSKIFPKGEALGGHKRHCIKGKTIFPPPVGDFKLLSIDLNELPPNEDEGNQEIQSLAWIEDI